MVVGGTHVFPGFLTPVLTQLSFQSQQLLCSHASAELRGEKMPGTKFASTRDRTHNHQVMSSTPSPMSDPVGESETGFADGKTLDLSIILQTVNEIRWGLERWNLSKKSNVHCAKGRKCWLQAFFHSFNN